MEGSMTRWTRLIPVLAIGLILAACGVDPVGSGTTSSDLAAPGGPRLNGGYGTGGNFKDGGGQTVSDTTIVSPTSSADAASTDTTKTLGGYGTGGN
jgi:hypothetical protein